MFNNHLAIIISSHHTDYQINLYLARQTIISATNDARDHHTTHARFMDIDANRIIGDYLLLVIYRHGTTSAIRTPMKFASLK